MNMAQQNNTVSGDFDLTMDELRTVARYVVMHAEDVLDVFEQAVPDDPRPRAAIEAAWTFINGANRTKLQRVASLDAHRAARSAPSEASRLAARSAGDAASAAYLHPIAQAGQVGHILRAAASAAHIGELTAGGDPARGDVLLDRSRQRATAVLTDVLRRYPHPPRGRSRVSQLMHALDQSLRQSDGADPGRAQLAKDRARTKAPGALTLSENDRRILASWAADCAERTLPLFLAEAPDDPRPREAIEGARAFARDEMRIGVARALAASAHAAAREVSSPAAIAAARATGHAVATAHMASHAPGVAYGALALSHAEPEGEKAAHDEVLWQIGHASPEVNAVLRKLPPRKEGKGLLARLVQQLQSGLTTAPEHDYFTQDSMERHSGKRPPNASRTLS